MKKHSERAHALLSASGASKWLNCTPSAKLEDEYAVESSSEFAEEGTIAHELSEAILRDKLDLIDNKEYKRAVNALRKRELFREEMHEELEPYIEYVMGEYLGLLKSDKATQAFIESRLDLTRWAPESFGTSDATMVGNGVLQIIDLKFGKGVKVDATDNPQLMLYALGAFDAFGWMGEIKTVRMGIVQPRLDHVSEFEMSLEDLLKWGDEVARPLALLAYDGLGECKAGKWCRWCKVKSECRALSEYSLEKVQSEFAEEDLRLMSDEEIGEVLERIEVAGLYFKAVSDYAMGLLLQGTPVKGYKLVEGRSIRRIKNESKAIEVLRDDFLLSDDQLFNTKLKGIGDIEKLIGKKAFNDAIGQYIEKPQGSPTMVPETDKRKEWTKTDDITNEFKSF